jgi:hypothetical protein
VKPSTEWMVINRLALKGEGIGIFMALLGVSFQRIGIMAAMLEAKV